MADILSQTLRLCFPPPIYSGLDMIANKRYRMDFCLCCTGTCYLSVYQNLVQTEPLSADSAQALIQRMPSIPASMSG